MPTPFVATLHSEPGDNDHLHVTFQRPLLLPEGERWGGRLLGLSCPPAKTGARSVVHVTCSAMEGPLSVQDRSADVGFHHRWAPSHARAPLGQRRVEGLTLTLSPPGQNAPQPSTAVLALERMPSLRASSTIFLASTDAPEGRPHHFTARLPSGLRLDRDRAYEMALCSITLNPYFRPLPYVYGTSDAYRLSWTPAGGIASTITKTVSQLFPEGSYTASAFGRAWHLIQVLLANPDAPDGALCYVNTQAPVAGQPEPTSIQVTWLVEGRLELPWPLLYLLGWRGDAPRLSGFASIGIEVNVGQSSLFELSSHAEQAFQPQNLLLLADCVETSPVGKRQLPLLKNIPLHRQAKHRDDYLTYEPADLIFRPFRFPEQEEIIFELKTPEGNYASFADPSAPVHVVLQLRCSS